MAALRLKFSAMKPNSSFGVNFHAGADVSRDYPLGEFREFVHGRQDALAEHVHDGDDGEERQRDRGDQRAIRAAWNRGGVRSDWLPEWAPA